MWQEARPDGVPVTRAEHLQLCPSKDDHERGLRQHDILKAPPARVVVRQRRVHQDDGQAQPEHPPQLQQDVSRRIPDTDRGVIATCFHRKLRRAHRVEPAVELVHADERIPRESERFLDVDLEPFAFEVQERVRKIGILSRIRAA